MNQPLSFQVRSELADYVTGNRSLQAFQEWFGRHALTPVALEAAPDAEDLVYEIELRLSEFAHGDWTEDQLKEQLRPLIQQSLFVVMQDAPSTSGTTTTVSRPALGFPGSLVRM